MAGGTRSALAAACLLLVAAGCKRDSFGPNTPARLRATTATEIRATVGTVVSPSPTFSVRDGDGRFVAGAALTFTVVEGGGTLANAPAVSLGGPTPIGDLTLGTTAGRNVVRVSVAGIPALDLVVIGTAGAPTELRAVGGDGQSGLAGASLPQPVVFQVADQYGNGVPAVPVSAATANVGAALSVSAVVTGADGRTPPIIWQIGRLGDPQLLTASAGALSTTASAQTQSEYSIDVRFTDTTPTTHQATFLSAVNRIRAIVVGDVPEEALIDLDASRCGAPTGQLLNETVDDVIIYADIRDLDGPGKILGRAGPCFIRDNSLLTVIGFMQFDAADVANMVSSGRFESVVMHEMLHVIGVGGLWRTKGLVINAGTSDPRFIGVHGMAGCTTIGFQGSCVGGVPLENIGGAGTAEVHWRESIFDSELMTGFADTPPMQFSALTTGALEDQGYLVNYLAVDPFAPAAALRWPAFPRSAAEMEFDVVLEPIGVLGPSGALRRIR
jgi:hypothetical protein